MAPDRGLTLEAGPLFNTSDPEMPISSLTPGTTDRPAIPPAAIHVARQIAQALADPTRDPRAPLDLALDPPELGRVRLSFAEVNGMLTLAISAERTETADLMRRHIALLSEEFAQAGLDAPSVSISHGGADQRRGSGPASQPSVPETPTAPPDMAPAAAPGRISHTTRSGLDLRL